MGKAGDDMVHNELDCTYILILLTEQNDSNGNVVMVTITGCMYSSIKIKRILKHSSDALTIRDAYQTLVHK